MLDKKDKIEASLTSKTKQITDKQLQENEGTAAKDNRRHVSIKMAISTTIRLNYMPDFFLPKIPYAEKPIL